MIIIVAAAAAPKIAQQVQRDREEELIHRGMQYRRAIREFSKHNGRFPLRLDELVETNGARYLRRQYKDPITGGEFRILHVGEISTSPAPNLNQSSSTQSSSTQSADQNTNASSDGSPSPATASDTGAGQTPPASPPGTPQTLASQGLSGPGPSGPGLSGSSGSDNQPVPIMILGVVSKSTKKTIREFDHKNHYNEWQFYYTPGYDGSIEVKGPTPTQPIFPNPLPGSSDQNGQPSSQPQQPSPNQPQQSSPLSSPSPQ
jgi:type II secretory pathway pseudopilin PulG